MASLIGAQFAAKRKSAPKTVSASKKKHHQTVISNADGAKVLKNLDNYNKDRASKGAVFLLFKIQKAKSKI
jgi:hypothetical protein